LPGPGVDGEVLCAVGEVAGAPDGGRVGVGDGQVVQAEPPGDPCPAVRADCCQAGPARQDDQAVASTADLPDGRKVRKGAPDAIVRFATDAVQSTRPLDIVWTNEKILGEWMQEIAIGGGVLVKSGMFCLPAVAKPGKIPKLKLATRGYSPENVEGDADDHFSKVVDDLMVKIPEAWARGDKDIAFKYRQYMNLGFSIASRETWKFIGCWKRSDRTLDLNDYGQKRNAPSTAKKRQSRASKLVRLPVAHRDPIMEEDMRQSLRKALPGCLVSWWKNPTIPSPEPGRRGGN